MIDELMNQIVFIKTNKENIVTASRRQPVGYRKDINCFVWRPLFCNLALREKDPAKKRIYNIQKLKAKINVKTKKGISLQEKRVSTQKIHDS